MKISQNSTLLCRWIMLFALLALVIFIGNVFIYMVKAFHYVPQFDDYRLTLYHVKPFLEGNWHVSLLWRDVHPNPIHGLVLIGSALFEQMRFQSLPYLLFPFIALKWVLYYQCFRCSTASSMQRCTSLLIGCMFGFIVFGYNFSGQYTWNSVAIAQIYHVIGALYLVALVVALDKPSALKSFLVLVIATLFHIISRQYSVPWILSSLLVLSPYLFTRPRHERFYIIQLLLFLALSLVLERLFFLLLEVKLHYNPNIDQMRETVIPNWWHRKSEMLQYFLASLASPLIKAYVLKFEYGFKTEHIAYLVYFASFSTLYSAAICVSSLNNRAYVLPLILIVFSVVTIVAGFIYRTDISTNWLYDQPPRYDSFRNVLLVATMWALSVSISKPSLFRPIHAVVLGSTLLLFFYTQALYHSYAWDSIDQTVAKQENTSSFIRFTYDQLKSNPNVGMQSIAANFQQASKQKSTPSFQQTGMPQQEWALGVVEYWGDNRLNVFSNESKNPGSN